MMKTKFLTLLVSGLVLAACNGQPSGIAEKQAQAASVVASETVQSAESAASGIKSQDGKIAIAVSGAFTDKLGDATMLPENVQAEELLLLQHNADENITIYAMQSGEIVDVKDYFSKLEQAIKNDNSLKNKQVNVSEDKLSYHFSHADASGESVLNESCIIQVQNSKVYNVCATSTDSDLNVLDEMMNQVVVAQ